jgi:glutamyl-tRNA synthetase
MKVRTRFAPSPTGYMHVGNLRAAIFAWLFARHSQGDFIIRLEDTDQARYVEGATELIFDTLKWIGIDWDEGPDKGGPYGPYVQTERRQTYIDWAQKLISQGLAYSDPYTPVQIETFRQQAEQQKKPFLFRNHRPESPPEWDGSQPLRFKVPQLKRYSWHDVVMGDLSAGPEALDDFILIKSDGLPTYNFANIVDDTEMHITHVTRGLEYIPSIPKYLSVYEALGIEPPIQACLPHILSPDGRKKLGKRDGAKSVTEYREQGIIPDVMMNFLASLGWNDGTEQEIFSTQELIEKFTLERVQKSGARFDEQRLIWMNGHYIRQMPPTELLKKAEDYWPLTASKYDLDYKQKVLGLVSERLKYFSEIPVLTEFFFSEPKINLDLITNNNQLQKFSLEELKGLLEQAQKSFVDSSFTVEDLTERLNNLLVQTNQKPAVLFSIIRIATTWAPASPGLADYLSVIGKDETLKRLDTSLTALSQT